MLQAFILASLLAQTPCDRDARVLKQVSPDFPESVRELGGPLEKTVVINVYVDAQGRAIRERTTSSSGLKALDDAALSAASKSTYLPRMVNCKAVPGKYVFKVTFSGN